MRRTIGFGSMACIALLAFAARLNAQALVGDSFTYQGRLTIDDMPANGRFDFQFKLFESSGAQVGNTVTKSDVVVDKGLFTVQLDFGSDAFDGRALRLQISERPGSHIGSYTVLSPTQPLTATPFALALRLPALEEVSSADTLLTLRNTGAGSAASFEIQNTSSSDTAVFAITRGTGTALNASSVGDGRAAAFIIGNANNDHDVMYSVTYGLGNAGSFRAQNSNNINSAVLGTHIGFGAGVEGVCSGGGNAVQAHNTGTGRAGSFVSNNANNSADTVFVDNFGNGSAIWARSRKLTNTDAVISAVQFGNGPAVFGSHAQTGNAGRLGLPTAAVYGSANTGNAGYFGGSVHVTGGVGVAGNLAVLGNLSKGGGSFKIDHPLDPENKYLYHSFVESPDMMNIYNGIVVLDERGQAVVTMPQWFSALNRDFRYQLTCIGGFAPVYVAEKMDGDHFKIAGGQPRLEVSWQVTGIRQDKFANANRIPVEEDKPDRERGKYLHAEAWGQPAERSVKSLDVAPVVDDARMPSEPR